MRPGARASSERGDAARPANAAAHRQDRLADDALELQRAAVTNRRRQARAQRVELIMQTLLQHTTRVDELAAVAYGPQQRLDDLRLGRPAGALAQQPDQRGAVTIVGLKPP
jgi:hypothetical protein